MRVPGGKRLLQFMQRGVVRRAALFSLLVVLGLFSPRSADGGSPRGRIGRAEARPKSARPQPRAAARALVVQRAKAVADQRIPEPNPGLRVVASKSLPGSGGTPHRSEAGEATRRVPDGFERPQRTLGQQEKIVAGHGAAYSAIGIFPKTWETFSRVFRGPPGIGEMRRLADEASAFKQLPVRDVLVASGPNVTADDVIRSVASAPTAVVFLVGHSEAGAIRLPGLPDKTGQKLPLAALGRVAKESGKLVLVLSCNSDLSESSSLAGTPTEISNEAAISIIQNFPRLFAKENSDRAPEHLAIRRVFEGAVRAAIEGPARISAIDPAIVFDLARSSRAGSPPFVGVITVDAARVAKQWESGENDSI